MLDVFYDIVALAGMFLAIYVMQKAELDRINRIDHPVLIWFRRLAFIFVALALCYSVLDQTWQRSLAVVLLVAAGVSNLTINALALTLRNPTSGHRMKVSSSNAVARKILR